MANALYPAAKERFLTGDLDLETATLKLALVSDAYTYDDSHANWTTDILPDAIGTPQAMTGMSVTVVGSRAVFDADSGINFGTVAAGSTIGSLVVFDDGATKTPIIYIDDAAGLPFSTNGGTVEVDFSTGTNKIFGF